MKKKKKSSNCACADVIWRSNLRTEAPTASAMPVTEGLPVAWPLPTKTMQKLSTNQSVAGANMAIQAKKSI